MIEKDRLYVYLKDKENEKIRKIFRGLNFGVTDDNLPQLEYDLWNNIPKNTQNELLKILNKKCLVNNILDTNFDIDNDGGRGGDIEREFMSLHDEEITMCWPYDCTFPKAAKLINYGIGVLKTDELLLPYGARYHIQQEEGEWDDKFIITSSDIMSFHNIEIPLSKKDWRLSNIYSGKETLKIVSTNMIYPEVYEELHKVQELIREGKYIDAYINALNHSHMRKIRDTQPRICEDYEPFSPDMRARKIHETRAQWDSPPKNKEELSQRIQFLLERIFEIDEVEYYKLENNYKKIIVS